MEIGGWSLSGCSFALNAFKVLWFLCHVIQSDGAFHNHYSYLNGACYMPGTVAMALITSSILTATLWGRDCCFCHVTGKIAAAQGGSVTCQDLKTHKVQSWESNPGWLAPECVCSISGLRKRKMRILMSKLYTLRGLLSKQGDVFPVRDYCIEKIRIIKQLCRNPNICIW